MKKLTLALMSLMLFLGMGTAFVQAETLPTMTFTPSGNNVSAAPGQTITFTVPEDLDFDACFGYSVILCYGFDVTGQLKPSYADIMAWMSYFQSEGQAPKPQVSYEAALIGEDMSTAVITIPTDASGLVEFSARLAAIDGDDMTTPMYSDMMDASYIVQGEVVKPAKPTFNPVSGEVEAGTAVTIASDAQMIWYCIDCEDEDLTMDGYKTSKCDQYDADETEIKIYRGQTIKAVSVVGYQDPFSFSEVATATYTVKGGDVERTDIPKLTVTPSESPVMATPTATFSCTMDPQSYTQTPQGLVGFRMSANNAANITKLEYQVGETMNADGEWTEYSEADIRNLGNGVPAIPDNTDTDKGDKSRLLIASGARTVHYRMTLNDATSASISFVCPEVSPVSGTITGTSKELVTATLQFQNPIPTVAIAPAEGEVDFGKTVTISAQPQGTKIYYTTDGMEPTEASTEYTSESNIRVFGTTTVKALAVNGEYTSTATASYTATLAAPTFYPEAGEVPFGTSVELECETAGATIYFTTDGSTPSKDNGEEYSWRSEIFITEAMTVKAVAVVEDYTSEVAVAEYTVAPLKAAVSITSQMREDTIGKNVSIGLSISDPENPASQMWIYTCPMSIYYTVDGITEPSKEAYEAQTDKENGVIKLTAVKWAEQWGEMGPVPDGNNNYMSVMFGQDTRLKAIGYVMIDEDQELVTPVLDTLLKVKSAPNPTFSIANYTKVNVGDTLVVKNPNPAPQPVEDEEGGDDFGGNVGEEEETDAPVGDLYFSFDGTLPTSAGYYAQEEDWESENGPYSNFKIFKAEGVDVEIIFGEDETGLYAYVPAITETLYGMAAGVDTIRLAADGHFSVKVQCELNEAGERDPMSWGPAPVFKYGSDFVTATYTLNEDLVVENPAFSVEAGEVEAGTLVELSCATYGATIYYTVDGSEPTALSTPYAEAIEIGKSMTVKAIAMAGDFKSEVVEAAYTAVVAAPVFSLESGDVSFGDKVEISCATEGAKIYYYCYIGDAEPTAAEYKGAIEITQTMTIRAEAHKGETKSEVAEATYTIIAKPTFSVRAGEVERGTEVELACATEGAAIYYTVDGSEPTALSTPYETAIVIDKAMTVKAIAIRGEAKSEIATAAYKLPAANEDLELAGVTVYPNPTSGQFNLDLPVAATVEVFMSNGMLYQRLSLGEGNTTLNINRSGIYFLRITGEGRTTVKRLIVR